MTGSFVSLHTVFIRPLPHPRDTEHRPGRYPALSTGLAPLLRMMPGLPPCSQEPDWPSVSETSFRTAPQGKRASSTADSNHPHTAPGSTIFPRYRRPPRTIASTMDTFRKNPAISQERILPTIVRPLCHTSRRHPVHRTPFPATCPSRTIRLPRDTCSATRD